MQHLSQEHSALSSRPEKRHQKIGTARMRLRGSTHGSLDSSLRSTDTGGSLEDAGGGIGEGVGALDLCCNPSLPLLDECASLT